MLIAPLFDLDLGLAKMCRRGNPDASLEEEYDPRYLRGIEFFNDCEFFEAHEVWEDLWSDHQGPSRRFYQGLIQAAVCLHHFGNGNVRGARKLYHGCRGYLEEYLPTHCGLNLEKLLSELETCCADILASQEERPRIDIDPELIPEIYLQPPPNSKSEDKAGG